jgi:hypothetical protein
VAEGSSFKKPLPLQENVWGCEGVKGCPTASRFACPLTPAGVRCYYRSDQYATLSEGHLETFRCSPIIKNTKMILKWYKFKILLCYNTFTATPILATGRRCAGMEILTSFFISVVASIIGYYVCKWLDGDT